MGRAGMNRSILALLVGPPRQCVEKLRRLEEAGVTDVLCQFELAGLPYHRAIKSMQRFAEEVVPVLTS